MLYLADTS